MKKYILILLIFTGYLQAQTLQNPTFGNTTTNTLKIKTPATVTSVNFLSTNEADGSISKISPINVNIPYTPSNYTISNQSIGQHLTGIDTRLGQISSTTAGITQRVYFTADNTTVTAGTFFTSSLTGKGSTATGSPPALVLADNTKGYFTKDVISVAFPAATIGYAGSYTGQLTVSATPTPVATQQRFTVEIYRTDNGGAPIASGVSGAPTGDLGVTVVAILDSGILNLTAGSITNIPVTGILTQNITLNTGERLRYHVSAAKIGAGGGNVTFGVYYGSSYNSYYDVPVAITTDAVLNKSTITGVTNTDALNNLDASVIHKNSTPETKTGVLTTYGSNVTDGTYNYSLSLQPIRNQFAAFFNQPFYASDQGYYVFRSSGTNIPARFYIMPNGTPTGTTSKFEMFNSDYFANYTTYNGFNILLNNSTNQIDIGPNRGVSGGVRQKLRIGSDYVGSSIASNVSLLDFNTDNTVNLNPNGGGVSFGGSNTDPFGLTLANQYTFTNPVIGQPARVNVVGNGWAAGLYFGRDAIRTASVATQATTSDVEISTNPTNSGTGLTANMRIWAATGNIAIQNGGTFTDNGDRFQVTGNASGSVAASNSNHFTRKGEVDSALALKANLASPSLTGTPTAPTATAGTNTTQIATTAFVQNASSSGTYTPTIAGIANFTSSTLVSATYTVVGQSVTVLIDMTVKPTSASTLTEFSVTLPIAVTTFGGTQASIGAGTFANTDYLSVRVSKTNSTTAKASFKTATDTNSGSVSLIFTYQK